MMRTFEIVLGIMLAFTVGACRGGGAETGAQAGAVTIAARDATRLAGAWTALGDDGDAVHVRFDPGGDSESLVFHMRFDGRAPGGEIRGTVRVDGARSDLLLRMDDGSLDGDPAGHYAYRLTDRGLELLFEADDAMQTVAFVRE
jgi:hypothetical protein